MSTIYIDFDLSTAYITFSDFSKLTNNVPRESQCNSQLIEYRADKYIPISITKAKTKTKKKMKEINTIEKPNFKSFLEF